MFNISCLLRVTTLHDSSYPHNWFMQTLGGLSFWVRGVGVEGGSAGLIVWKVLQMGGI